MEEIKHFSCLKFLVGTVVPNYIQYSIVLVFQIPGLVKVCNRETVVKWYPVISYALARSLYFQDFLYTNRVKANYLEH